MLYRIPPAPMPRFSSRVALPLFRGRVRLIKVVVVAARSPVIEAFGALAVSYFSELIAVVAVTKAARPGPSF